MLRKRRRSRRDTRESISYPFCITGRSWTPRTWFSFDCERDTLLYAVRDRLWHDSVGQLYPLPLLPNARPLLHIRGQHHEEPPAHHPRAICLCPSPLVLQRLRRPHRRGIMPWQRRVLAQGVPYRRFDMGKGCCCCIHSCSDGMDDGPFLSTQRGRSTTEREVRRSVGCVGAESTIQVGPIPVLIRFGCVLVYSVRPYCGTLTEARWAHV